MDSKHIERDYSAHRKSVIRPHDEYVKLEIFSFDPQYTQTYLREDNTLSKGSNITKTSWKSWSCFKSTDKQNAMVFNIKYNVLEDGEYRVDLIYEQNSTLHNTKKDTGKDLIGHMKIGEVFDDDILFDGENNVIKRSSTFLHMGLGSKDITIKVPYNCYFYGAIIRKVIKFVGDNYYGDALGSEEGNMVLTDCTVTNGDMVTATELSAEIFYDPIFECDASPSGFYIDYRDEMNFYVRDNAGKLQQIFGGYVSSILPNGDRTTLTIHGADRLSDGQNKYILDQMKIGGGTSTESTYKESMTKNFDNYPQALQYLCQIHETTLDSNISREYTVDGETFHDGFTITFGSKKKVKKVSASNGVATPSKNYIMLRNNSDSKKQQSWTLYDASKYAKKPIDITKYGYLHITYGLGKAKKSYQSKTTEKVDTSNETAGSQSFSKCGVSKDGKYIMAIGLPSASKDSKKGWTKTIFKRKCPHCGSTNLVWDIFYGGSSGWGHAPCRGNTEGGGVEGHIFCKSCDADYSVQGHEHYSWSKYKLEKVGSTVSSSKSEAQKLRNGNLSAVPGTSTEISSDDIFKAITKTAFKYKYVLGGGSSTYSSMKKTGFGDCWAFSELIFTELKRYGVSCQIKEYRSTPSVSNHRTVIYKDANGKWQDFPYREQGWGKKYNNMLNNYPIGRSFKGRTIQEYKGSNIGNVKAKTSTSKTQTSTVTHTSGYDKDKPFQGFLRIGYSLKQDFKAKKYTVDVNFTYNSSSSNAVKGLNLYWVNNTIKKATLKLVNDTSLIDYLKAIHGEGSSIYLQSIQMITPKVPLKKKDDGTYEDTSWYKSDKSTDDQSSCKMNIYQITFDDNKGAEPSDMQSCGKTVNAMMKEIVDEAGYYVNMSYGLHRINDKIHFRVVNNSAEQFIASEGDNNNILSWNSISYSPIGSMFNMSMQVFKDQANIYHYIDTRDGISILNYGEQCTLQTSNDVLSEKQAYFNAIHSSKYNPSQTYTYTITVPNMPNLKIGDLVKVVANAKKLNNVKEVKSIKVVFQHDKLPRIQTTIGLDELAPDIQLQKNIRKLRDTAKEESTEFDSSATPVTNEMYYEWDV